MIGRHFIRAFVLIVAVGIVALFSVGVYRSIRHRQAREEMATAITRLAMHQPPGIAKEQWAFCIHWTWNLHANFGAMFYAPTGGLQRLARQLNSRIDSGPDLSTIDWVWDQYIEMYPPSAAYEKWRPTSPQNREAFLMGSEALGGSPLSWWQSEYRRRSENGGTGME